MNMNVKTSAQVAALALAIGQSLMVAPCALAQAQDAETTVVVTGIRASARSSVAIKRDTMEVVDSITADDIGKLPDPNVGETLTRIPGVQSYRFGGEASAPFGGFGSGVTIRGLGYTAFQTNGRSYFSAGSREFNVEAAIPGMVAGIDVYKNPSAEHIEGGIGGLVNVRTRNPSDFKNLTVALGVNVRENDLARKANPELFGMVANRFDLGGGSRIGVMAAGTYQKSTVRNDNNPANRGPSLKRAVRADSAEYATAAAKNTSNARDQPMAAYVGRNDISYLANVPTTGAQTPDMTKVTANELKDAMVGAWVNSNVFQETIMRERKGLNLAADYRVSNTLRFYTEANYFSFLYHQHYRGLNSNDGANVRNLQTTPFNYDENLANRNSNGGSNDQVLNKRLLSGTFLNSTMTTVGGDEHTPWETIIGAFGVEWSPTPRLSLKADFNYIKSDKKSDNRSVRMDSAAGLQWETSRVADGAPHYLNFSGPSLSDPQNFVFKDYSNGQNYHTRDNGYAMALSGAYDMDGFFSKLRFGGRFAYQHDETRNYGFGRPLPAVSATTLAGNLQQAPSNFMRGEAGYSGGYLVYNPNALLGDQVRTAFPNAGILAQGSYAENVGQRTIFGEHDSAAYLVGDFSAFDERLRGNVGVRLVHTNTKAMARAADGRPGAAAGTFVDVEGTSSYTNVLPTMNMTYDLAPDTLVRAGFGRGMTRPGLGALNPSVGVNLTNGTGSIGNTKLKPLVADSFDISLEHYFSKTNYASLALFDKEIKDFPNGVISCETLTNAPRYTGVFENGCADGQYSMVKSVNSEKGYARGFEVAGQYFFDASHGILNNFGVSGSYSYVKTSNPVNFGTAAAPRIVDTMQPFVSKNNVSLAGMYEDKKLSARLVYTWRSPSVLFNVDPFPIWARYIKAYGLLDGSLSYELNDNLTLRFNASNILNKAANRGIGEPGATQTPMEFQHFYNGRTYSMGLSYKFGAK
jgi:TonB-dependent receptor